MKVIHVATVNDNFNIGSMKIWCMHSEEEWGVESYGNVQFTQFQILMALWTVKVKWRTKGVPRRERVKRLKIHQYQRMRKSGPRQYWRMFSLKMAVIGLVLDSSVGVVMPILRGIHWG